MTQNLEMQTRNALTFVQKLYFEISYLIKEVEGLLHLEDEEFVYLSMKGILFNLPLFSVQTSEDISQKIVEPMLAQYRKI